MDGEDLEEEITEKNGDKIERKSAGPNRDATPSKARSKGKTQTEERSQEQVMIRVSDPSLKEEVRFVEGNGLDGA